MTCQNNFDFLDIIFRIVTDCSKYLQEIYFPTEKLWLYDKKYLVLYDASNKVLLGIYFCAILCLNGTNHINPGKSFYLSKGVKNMWVWLIE